MLMVRITDWDDYIGRRLRLKDLRVFFAVVRAGSLAAAAANLRVTQPAVSQVIADLEHSLGVRLFDRTSRGVVPTLYARALLMRGRAAFDELRDGIRDIEFLSDPTSGEVRIGSVETLSATLLPEVIRRFSERYPRVVLHVDDLTAPAAELPGLRERKYDLVLVRLINELMHAQLPEDLQLQQVFQDQLVIAAGAHNRWARRRKFALVDLVQEPWILAPAGTWNRASVEEAFLAEQIQPPKPAVVSVSMALRIRLLLNGPFLAAFPRTVLQLNRALYSLKVLPIKLRTRHWPVMVITLKRRTPSPVVERFIACVNEVAEAMVDGESKAGNRNVARS
jgi:DNA-binding transcriptional LysR family regulator